MKHLKIEEILEKRFEKLNEAFEKARLHFQENDIRVFRVKVKKLASFLLLVDAAKAHGHPVKLPAVIIKLGQLFGEVRTLQLQQTAVHNAVKEMKIALPEAYLTYLSNLILQHMADASEHIKGEHPFRKEEEKLLKLLPAHLSHEAVLHYVRAEGDYLEKLFTPVFPSDRSFHEARKHLKNLLYISPYVSLEMDVLSTYKSLKSFEAIGAFTKLLGGFQDSNILLSCLHDAVSKFEPDETERIILHRLEQRWFGEREAFRIQIYDELREIMASGRTAAASVEWVVM